MLLVGGAGMNTVSWDHFFTSLNQYYIGLRQSVPHAAATGFHHHAAAMSAQRTITPQEVEGLRAVLHLIATVVHQVSVLYLGHITTASFVRSFLACTTMSK